MKKYYTLLLTILIAISIQAQPPGRIVFNSSFEEPVINCSNLYKGGSAASPCWDLVPDNLVNGWNVSGPDKRVEFWKSGFLGVPSQHGNQHIELNAAAVAPVFFEICMYNTETLNWSFWHRGRSGVDVMRLVITSATGDVLYTNNFSTGNTAWVNYTGTVINTGPNGKVTFTYSPVSTAGGNPTVGNLIDNIVITGLVAFTEFDKDTYGDQESVGGNIPRILVNGNIPLGGAIVQVNQIGGTASQGPDFTLNPTINIPAGNYDGTLSTSFPINLVIKDDNDFEPDEDAIFEIVNVSPATAITLNDATCNGTTIARTTYTIINDDIFLPVNLIQFDVAKSLCNKNILKWSSTDEKDFYGYEIQRSEDLQNWETIGFVSGSQNNSSHINNYSFVDHLDKALVYYRLKQIDLDQTFKYSHTVYGVNPCHSIDQKIEVYPNPVINYQDLKIKINSDSHEIMLELYDLQGRKIKGKLISLSNEGENEISFSTENINPGNYILHVISSSKTWTEKITVK